MFYMIIMDARRSKLMYAVGLVLFLISTSYAYQLGVDQASSEEQDNSLNYLLRSLAEESDLNEVGGDKVLDLENNDVPQQEYGTFGYLASNMTEAQVPDFESPEITRLIAYLQQQQPDFGPNQGGTNTRYEISNPVNDPSDFDLSPTEQNTEGEMSKKSAEIDSLLTSYLQPIFEGMQRERQQRLAAKSQKNYPTGEQINQILTRMPYEELVARLEKMRDGGEDPFESDLAPPMPEHHFVQGGSGEGKQFLGPDGSFENVQVIKTDRAVPSYCDPPNPCPVGYTEADGCLENFVNSASFSREYQIKQQCSCDNEHSLFNCAAPASVPTLPAPATTTTTTTTDKNTNDDESQTGPENQIGTLARVINFRYGGLPSVMNLISKHENSLTGEKRSRMPANEQQQQPTIVKKAYKANQHEFRY